VVPRDATDVSTMSPLADFARGESRDGDAETGENAGVIRGTEGSNLVSSSGESANFRSGGGGGLAIIFAGGLLF